MANAPNTQKPDFRSGVPLQDLHDSQMVAGRAGDDPQKTETFPIPRSIIRNSFRIPSDVPFAKRSPDWRHRRQSG